jgi:hypothetical protein
LLKSIVLGTLVGTTAVVTVLALPQAGFACACCADAGAWSQTSQPISSVEFNELNRLQFAPTAKRYLTAGEDNTGIDPNSIEYTLTLTKKQRKWIFLFKDERGKTGTISLTIPVQGTAFKTDLYDRTPGSNSTLLYKELRLEGKVTGDRIFAKSITPDTKFRLILQGRGNNCTSAEDFKTWNLQIFGTRSNYSFYSSFK